MKSVEAAYKAYPLTDDYMNHPETNAKRVGFQLGYEQCEKDLIDKACEWLYQWNRNQVEKHGSKAIIGCNDFTIPVSDFRKAMEE